MLTIAHSLLVWREKLMGVLTGMQLRIGFLIKMCSFVFSGSGKGEHKMIKTKFLMLSVS